MEMLTPKEEALRTDYISRVNRVLDHIELNLGEPLTVEDLADVAAFSPFHFHRIFTSMVGEPLFHYLQRLRIERAATDLHRYPNKPVTDIALDTGFSSSAVFARTFKKTFGVSASEWRKSKESKTRRNTGKDRIPGLGYTEPIRRRNTMNNLMEDVKVEEKASRTLAYIRYIGPYKGDATLFGGLIGRVMAWAGPRGLAGRPGTELITIYHDNPDLTDDDKLRISLGLTVDADTEVSGEISKLEIPPGHYARARFELDADSYAEAWDWLYGTWLPSSGWEPAEGPCYESYVTGPDEHPEGKHLVDICLSVRPVK